MMRHSSVSKLLPAFVVAIVALVITYNSIRDGGRHYLLRQALVHPKFSAWRRLLNYGDEGSFLDLTGFDFRTFRELVDRIAVGQEMVPLFLFAILFSFNWSHFFVPIE